MSQRLIGPRIFELERMLAIFHSITNYEVIQTIDIHMQVVSEQTRADLGGNTRDFKINCPS